MHSGEIAQNPETGQLMRRRPIYGTRKDRDVEHARYEQHIAKVEADAGTYIKALAEWRAKVQTSATIAIVGGYAHVHGLSFFEALDSLFWHGKDFWTEVSERRR